MLNSSNLPMRAMDQTPTPNELASSIIGLVKKRGRIVGYQLDNNQILDKQSAVEQAKMGNIKGVGIAHRGDTEYLKALPDDNENNNLGSLPTVSTENGTIY